MALQHGSRPPSGDETHNLQAPGHGWLQMFVPINEAAAADGLINHVGDKWGETLHDEIGDLYGSRYVDSNGDEISANAALAGGYLATASGSSEYFQVLHNRSGGNLTFPRGTMMFHGKLAAFDSFFGGTSGVPAYNGMFRMEQQSGPYISVGLRAEGSYRDYEWTGIDPTSDITLIMSWGEQGWRAWCNNTEPDGGLIWAVGGKYPKIQAAVIGDGEEVRLGRDRGDGYFTTYIKAFGWWEWELSALERRRLWTDPWCASRPQPDTTKFASLYGPRVGRVTDTGATFRFNTARTGTWAAGTAYAKVIVSDNEIGDDSGTDVTGTGNANTADTAIDITPDLSGFSAGDTLYYQCQWSTDGATYYNFPNGNGTVTLRRTLRSDSFTMAFVADWHTGKDNAGTTVLALDDVPYSHQVIGHARLSTQAQSKHYAYIKAMQAMATDAPEFVIDLGDNWYQRYGYDSGNTQADKNRKMQHVANVLQGLFNCGGYYLVPGNHEGSMGHDQDTGLGKLAVTAQLLWVPNPDNATYAQGGENETGTVSTDSFDWLPPLDSNFNSGDDQQYAGHSGANVTYNDAWRTSNALGYGGSALRRQNYYGFSWGPVDFFCLDSCTYSLPGHVDTSGTRTTDIGGTSSFWLGPTQFAWLKAQMAASTAKFKIACMHYLPGGIWCNGTGDANTSAYGRGSGASIRFPDPTPLPAAFSAPAGGERELVDLCRAYGAIIVKGHDHRFSHVVNAGVHFITVPTAGATSHIKEAGNGWENTYIRNDYGKSEVRGRDRTGQKAYHNCLGYVLLDVTPNALTFRLRQSAMICAIDESESDIWPAIPMWRERWVGPVETFDEDSNTVTVPDTPDQVYVVCEADKGVFDDAGSAGCDSEDEGEYDRPTLDTGLVAVANYTENNLTGDVPADSTNLADGDSVRVGYTPRDLYKVTISAPRGRSTFPRGRMRTGGRRARVLIEE